MHICTQIFLRKKNMPFVLEYLLKNIYLLKKISKACITQVNKYDLHIDRIFVNYSIIPRICLIQI